MLEAPRRMTMMPEPWPPQPAASASHLRQGREAPRGGRAHNSAETPWQLSISIVKTSTLFAGMSEPIARPP